MGGRVVVLSPVSHEQLMQALEDVHDPHVPVSLRSMGMLQSVACDAEGQVRVTVRMPCMACPGASKIVDDVKTALSGVPGVAQVDVDLGWSGEWRREMVEPGVRQLMKHNGILI